MQFNAANFAAAYYKPKMGRTRGSVDGVNNNWDLRKGGWRATLLLIRDQIIRKGSGRRKQALTQTKSNAVSARVAASTSDRQKSLKKSSILSLTLPWRDAKGPLRSTNQSAQMSSISQAPTVHLLSSYQRHRLPAAFGPRFHHFRNF